MSDDYDLFDQYLNNDSQEYDEFFDDLLSSGNSSSSEDDNSPAIVDADEIINSLNTSTPSASASSKPARMTDLGLKMSQMILKQSSSNTSTTASSPSLLDVDEGDQLVDNYGQRRIRPRPGKRGRPKGTVKDATTQFGRSSTSHALPPAVAALMGRANLAYVQRDYDAAVELYLQVVQRAPASPEPYYSLGLVWEERGDANRAASYFLISAHLQGKADAELWRKIAALLVQVPERKEQAIYALTRAIKRQGRAERELYLLRAKLHLELRQYRQVINSLGGLLRQQLSSRGASDDDDGEFDAFAFLARVALHMSLAYLAAAVLEESLNWALKHGFPFDYNLLNLLTELRAVDEDWLGVLVAVESFLPACHQATGAEQGRTEWWLLSDAERLQRALEAAPVELRFAHALASFRLRRPEGSLEALLCAFTDLVAGTANEARPSAVVRQLTDALMDAGEYAEALKIYLAPETTQMTTEMGLKMTEAYMRLGEFTSAEESIEAILHVNPDSCKARFLLADIYRATGRIEEALQVLPTEPADADDRDREKEFINWRALDGLFERSLGVTLDLVDDNESDADSVYHDESSGSSGTATPNTTATKRRLRFGPERIKRSKSAKAVRRHHSAAQLDALKQKIEAMRRGDCRAAEAVLRACGETEGTGLTREEWSGAVFESIQLQLRLKSNELRILQNALKRILEFSQLSNDAQLRLLLLYLCHETDSPEEVLSQLKWFISWCPHSPRPLQLLSALSRQSSSLSRSTVSANFFRFLVRKQAALPQGSFALHLVLGHQSLTTHNYEEAARQYWRAAALAPRNAFVHLCVGNALLWRAFQRTCLNQPATLAESLTFFLRAVELSAGSVKAKYNLGRALQMAGFKGEAVRVYREIAGEFVPARYNLSRLLLQSLD